MSLLRGWSVRSRILLVEGSAVSPESVFRSLQAEMKRGAPISGAAGGGAGERR